MEFQGALRFSVGTRTTVMTFLFAGNTLLRLRVAGGSTVSLWGCGRRTDVPGTLPGLGTSGKGQVVSLSLSGQNGRTLS